jgi:hypothetical protein
VDQWCVHRSMTVCVPNSDRESWIIVSVHVEVKGKVLTIFSTLLPRTQTPEAPWCGFWHPVHGPVSQRYLNANAKLHRVDEE